LESSFHHTVFLDRDGVINEDSPDYVKSWAEFRFIPGSLAAIAELTKRGFRILVISNQSGVGRGLITPSALARMHRNLVAAAAESGGRIDDIFFCPHRPDENCECRKPRPGLFRKACREHAVDLSAAVMVGDSAKDVIAARRAGCALSVLVETGDPASAKTELAAGGIRPDHVAADLKAAADWIIKRWG
jgi:D-glycero-D-manno-heptose 1,7-bisphosphate phosphatase